MGWHGTREAVGAGAQWKRRQTKAKECQMEIMLHSPRGIRRVINSGWKALRRRLRSQGTPQKALHASPLGRVLLVDLLFELKLRNYLKTETRHMSFGILLP